LWNLNLTGNRATRKPVRTLLPVLTVLFVVSYGLLTMLVVEQGRTIESQRSLIRMLFDDSVQLSNLKGKANQKQQAEAQARAQTQVKPPTARVAPRDPKAKSPSSQAPRAEAKNQSASKFARPLPQKPPKDTSDEVDERRALNSI
jgi:hypothetical protein